jgi:hypothetical protein
MAVAVSWETLLILVDAALRRDEVVECPRNGHTAENLRRELICIIVD